MGTWGLGRLTSDNILSLDLMVKLIVIVLAVLNHHNVTTLEAVSLLSVTSESPMLVRRRSGPDWVTGETVLLPRRPPEVFKPYQERGPT